MPASFLMEQDLPPAIAMYTSLEP